MYFRCQLAIVRPPAQHKLHHLCQKTDCSKPYLHLVQHTKYNSSTNTFISMFPWQVLVYILLNYLFRILFTLFYIVSNYKKCNTIMRSNDLGWYTDCQYKIKFWSRLKTQKRSPKIEWVKVIIVKAFLWKAKDSKIQFVVFFILMDIANILRAQIWTITNQINICWLLKNTAFTYRY